jgi:hypothetical protein
MDKFIDIDREKHWDRNLDKTKIYFDKDTLNSIFKSLDLNQDAITAHSGTGVFTRPEKLHKYEKTREISNVLGVPAWILLTEHAEEEVISRSENETDEKLISYKLSSLADLLHTFENDVEDVNLSSSDRALLETNLTTTWEIIKDNEDWSILWDKMYKYIKNGLVKDKFDWAGNILFLKGHEITHIATLKVFKQKIDKSVVSGAFRTKVIENDKLSIQNAWLFIKKNQDTAKYPSLLDKILINISHFFGNSYLPDIKLESNDKNINLFSWHSHFDKKKQDLGQLTKIYNKKVKRFNDVSETLLFKVHDYFYFNPSYPDLHKINSYKKHEDQQLITKNLTDKLIEDHQLTTLEFLAKRGFLKDGSRLAFKFQKKYLYFRLFPADDPFWFATVIDDGGKKVVRWDYDHQIYHLTPLTNKMLEMMKIDGKIKHGAKLWSLEGDNQDMYSLVSSLKKHEIENDGHYSLF